MTPGSFGRHTILELEERLAGAKWRVNLTQDLAALTALLSIADWKGGSLSLRRMLGREPVVLDDRWQSIPPAGGGEELPPDAEQMRLITAAGMPTGWLSVEELEQAHRELDPEWHRARGETVG